MLRKDEPSFRSAPPSLPGASGLRLAFPALAGLNQFLPARNPTLLEPASQEAEGAARPAGSARGLEGPGRADPMAARVEQRLGGLPVFTRDDFEGTWRPVASGGFSQVFQARHKRWRTEYAIKCSRCLQPDTIRYPPAYPLLLRREARGPGSSRGRGGRVEAEDCSLHFSKLCPVA